MADLRQACDRCHGMKLRCPKPLGSPACTRCAKAGTPCTFSPPTRPSRNGPPADGAAAAAFDWPAFTTANAADASAVGFEPLLPPPPTPPFSAPSPSWALPAAANGRSDGEAEGPSPPASSEAAQLASTIAELDSVLRGFPDNRVHHVPRDQLEQYADAVGDYFELHYTLEVLLRHTEKVARLYPEVVRAATAKAAGQNPDDDCNVPDCIQHDRVDLRSRRLPKVDYVLLGLLVACHQRILDVIDIIIEHGRLCSIMTAKMPEGYVPKFNIPQIRIGAFVAPKGSAGSMVVSMMFELHGLLIKESQDLGATVSTLSADSPRQASVLTLQCEILKERGEEVIDELKQLKGHLIDLGLVR